VQKIFTLYDAGMTVAEITHELNRMGMKTAQGNSFNQNSLHTILKNEKYIGIYERSGIRIEDAVPPIVDKGLFERVQKRLAENRQAPARYKASVHYLLSGKLYCGNCGAGMIGESGVNRKGIRYCYYICFARKRNCLACPKKTVRKDWLEDLVVRETVANVLQPERIKWIAKCCAALSAREDSKNEELKHLHKQLSETEKSIHNLIAAMEQGVYSASMQTRLAELEATREKLCFDIEVFQAGQPTLTEQHILFMLSQFRRETSDKLEAYNEDLIECFVHAVYLYDDKLIVMYNLMDDTKKTERFRSILEFPSHEDNISAVPVCSDLDVDGRQPEGLYEPSNSAKFSASKISSFSKMEFCPV